MGKVLVAYAQGDADVGSDLADALAAAGLDVATAAGSPGTRADKDRFDAASRVVLVWSRKSAGEVILRREAVLAASRGKLALVRVDGLAQPPLLRTPFSVAVPRARIGSAAGPLARRLTRSDPSGTIPKGHRMPTALETPAAGNEGNTWKGTLLLVVLFAAIAYGALYLVNGGDPTGAVQAFMKQVAG